MVAPSKEEILPPWGMAAAGAAGSVFANAVMYPLDIVKTRLQVQVRKQNSEGEQEKNEHHYDGLLHAVTKIVEDEGITGLYSGISSSLLGVASTNFAYFYWYSFVRSMYLKSDKAPKPPSTAIELCLGAAAGALAQICTIPVAVVTTRQQTQLRSEKKGLFGTTKEIIDSEDGYSGLWRGLKASLILCVNPSITYGVYARLKDTMYPNKLSLHPLEAFMLGAISKAMATIVTQPLIVAKVRLQSRPPPERNGKPFKSFTEVLKYTMEHEGPTQLFKGLLAQLAKTVLVQGLLMMTKERVELLFVLLFRYVQQMKAQKLQQAVDKIKQAAPITTK